MWGIVTHHPRCFTRGKRTNAPTKRSGERQLLQVQRASSRSAGLEGLPVVVLSNNDGCVVARSAEANALQIPMCSLVTLARRGVSTGAAAGGVQLQQQDHGDMSRRFIVLLAHLRRPTA